MDEIGQLLKMTREANGVSITEASEDLKIKEVLLHNIEDGNIGGFKDVFVLQEYILSYSKYLGLDSEKIENEFNDYMFEYTSKISNKKIEKAIIKKNKEEKNTPKIASPYTRVPKKDNPLVLYIFFILGIVILLIIIFFIIKTAFFS